MKLKIDIIDAFTDTVFKGNSAGVIVLADDHKHNLDLKQNLGWLDDELMQSIATQNNLSETAFIKAINPSNTLSDEQSDKYLSDDVTYHIRWFSPLMEIDFCGHATLASAFVLFERLSDKNNTLSKLHFYAEAVGKFDVIKRTDGKIEMDFPNQKPERIPDNALPQALIDGLPPLCLKSAEVYQNQQAYFVICESEDDVLSVKRDNKLLASLAPYDIAVTCLPQSKQYAQYDFISRYFWPASGGDEDPVTGSAHTGLAPLWAARLGKDTLLAYQASSRGGELECTLRGDRVLIAGNAMRYLSGVIEV